MNKLLQHSLLLVTILLSIYLLGCGGSSGNNVAGIDGSGAPVTAASGTINGFGSVIVNGVRYQSDNATILVNGVSASESSLRTGYQVRVTGTLNNDGSGNATRIEFNPNLIGAITHIDLQNEQITLLQQTVQITNATLFDEAITPNDLTGLSLGTAILVSGQLTGDGIIAATRIELAPQTTQQLTGFVNNLNINESHFYLNNLLVKFSSATIINAKNNQLANGLRVTLTGSEADDSVFQAATITAQPIGYGADVKTAEIEGFVTRFTSATDFDVAGITCSTDSNTLYENGTSATLAAGSSIKVSGSVNAAGVLVAKKIEFRQKVINEISGEISDINLLTTGAISSGSFVVSGTTIYTNNSTAYDDGSYDKLRRFNFSDLRAGNLVKVSGYLNAEKFVATKIERKRVDNNPGFRFEGVVTQVATDGFVLYGQQLRIDNQTEIRNATGALLTQEQFLAEALNQQVRVQVTVNGGVLTATKIELRSRDQDGFHRPQPGDHSPGPEPR